MTLRTILLAERRLIVQGFALLILRLLLDAAHFRTIHPRHRPKRFYEADQPPLAAARTYFTLFSLFPCPSGGWTPHANAFGPASSLYAPCGRWRTRPPLSRWAGTCLCTARAVQSCPGRAQGRDPALPLNGTLQDRNAALQPGVCFSCSCAARTCPASRSQGSLRP